jgi:hypothetical protein
MGGQDDTDPTLPVVTLGGSMPNTTRTHSARPALHIVLSMRQWVLQLYQ